MAFVAVEKKDLETSVAFLQGRPDRRPGNAKAMSAKHLYQICTKEFYSPVLICRKSLLPKEGLEPSPPCEDRILRPARLPIPPLRRLYLTIGLRRSRYSHFVACD